MRLVPDEVLDLIAGGWSSEASRSIQVVTIVGEREVDQNDNGDWWHGSGGGGYDGSGAAGAQESVPVAEPHVPCTPIHSSPVPANVPANVDVNALRNIALDAGWQMKQMDSRIEHGMGIIRSANGDLRLGEVNHGVEGSIKIGISLYPGDTIVGYIHSHPALGDIDQKRPSSYDFDQWNNLSKGVRADTNMMVYIMETATGNVFEYAKGTNQRSDRAGANISKDITSAPGCGG